MSWIMFANFKYDGKKLSLTKLVHRQEKAQNVISFKSKNSWSKISLLIRLFAGRSERPREYFRYKDGQMFINLQETVGSKTVPE